ncbi:MAG: alpha/beta hydrolase-fold protein [Fuerstiella sp.]|nr:alpha/beta hydrolase-fold protein [Fuerstiella sp.]
MTGPGAVRLDNGMVLRGLCDLSNTLDPFLENQHLELRKIDQGFRTYFVSTRRSSEKVGDARAVPNQEFLIVQRRTGRHPMNFLIGLHTRTPFQLNGQADVTLNQLGGGMTKLPVGITSLNRQMAAVDGLTHDWKFGVSMYAIPEDLLYSGSQAGGLVTQVTDYQDGATRLNLAQMLMEAEKYVAAQRMLQDIPVDFPELEPRCNTLIDGWNQRVGNRLMAEVTSLKASGKHRLAVQYGRAYPDEKLAAVLRVRAKQLIEDHDETTRRIEDLQVRLPDIVGQIEHNERRSQAMRMWNELRRHIDFNTLQRFSAFELLAQDDELAAEAKVALAASGWMLGANEAIDGFAETFGLFQIRYRLQDYVQTTDDESRLRSDLLDEIRTSEGFSAERVAGLIRHLPPLNPIPIDQRTPLIPGDFSLGGDDLTAACIGHVPREYAVTRNYPLLIALPRAGASASDTLAWWAADAERNGYVVVVPDLYRPNVGSYDASAEQHRRLLNLVTQLKSGLSIDDDRVFVAGHGIGGEAAMDLAASHPDLFAGVVSIAGLGRRNVTWSAHNSTSLPWYVVVGSRQPNYVNRMTPLLKRLFRRSDANREFCDVLFVRYTERGFESYSEELPNLFRWFNVQSRPNLPNKIDARVLRTSDLDWFWLELESLPERFAQFEYPTGYDDRPGSPTGSIDAGINGNYIRITSLPTKDAAIRISPDMPGLDIEQKITIRVAGRNAQVERFVASARDMLEDFRTNRDRSRLCHMKIHLKNR